MRLVIALLLSLLPLSVFASPPEPEDKYLSRCHVTPEVRPKDRYPGRAAIIPSNKPALPAGKAVYAKGELVFLSGRVLDENCVPISDAIIDIWQASPQGKYVKPTLGQRVSPDPYFTGSGRAVTNNLGQFNFVTLFPASYGHNHRAPHIHVHVIKEGFRTIDTEMYFSNDSRNTGDPKLARLSQTQRALVTAKVWQRDKNKPQEGLAAEWDITLKGKNSWRHF